MDKKLILRAAPGADAMDVSFEAGATVEDIVKNYGIQTDYPAYAARINNKIFPLTACPEDGD